MLFAAFYQSGYRFSPHVLVILRLIEVAVISRSELHGQEHFSLCSFELVPSCTCWLTADCTLFCFCGSVYLGFDFMAGY